ncbi:MAG: type VI secretion system tip protein VgrG [Planctomycetes bacterium]|nr:type VI secretion system tip protein VgrG [Planctomycetota bacterium]
MLVSRYHGTEGLSQLYRFEIDLVAEDADVSLDDSVGRPAVLSMFTPHGDRWVHGIVARIAHLGETVGQTYYRVELVPALWLLTHRYQSRIFQGQNVLEIISAVLAQAGFPADYLNTECVAPDAHLPREYCVQYRETDFNFISRLLEDEGIFYRFEQTETGHQMVLAESREAYQPIAG